MTKKLDITSNVMKRIVIVEKKNLLRNLAVLVGIFASLLLAFVAVTVIFIQDVKDLGTWDVLTLFWEDREIVADYWRDALSTFWLEVPNEYILILFGLLVISWIIYYRTRDRRKTYSLRSQKLASYEKSSKIEKERKV